MKLFYQNSSQKFLSLLFAMLLICGSTSLVSHAGNPLNDFTLDEECEICNELTIYSIFPPYEVVWSGEVCLDWCWGPLGIESAEDLTPEQITGTPWTIDVSNAIDQYENLLQEDNTIEVTSHSPLTVNGGAYLFPRGNYQVNDGLIKGYLISAK